MNEQLPESLEQARIDLVSAMGNIATAMATDHRWQTTPMRIVIRELNAALTLLDRITSPF